MTSLLGHEFRKQALHRVGRILGPFAMAAAPAVTRMKALAALFGFNRLAHS